MTEMIAWTGIEVLPENQTILLEASAGTGKTWQIEALVVRLIAEHGLSIEDILVITFTKAATTELRDRIRRRLVQARDALSLGTAPTEDPIEAMLWADEESRVERQSRLAAAVASFDLAPISTIHGFSQRMLEQLAFESGQEPGLELLADPGPLLQQMVDDELARVFAQATETELDLLADMGWSREPLMRLAKAMTGAVEPVIEPAAEDGDPLITEPLAPVQRWLAVKDEFKDWLAGPKGIAAIDAIRTELALKSKQKRVKNMRKTVVGKYLDSLRLWLEGPAGRKARSKGTWADKLEMPALEKVWKEDAGDLEAFGGTVFFRRVSELFAAQDQLWPLSNVGFACRARAKLNAELERGGLLTYSTMLSRLAERILAQATEPEQEESLAAAIRSRFKVALVDEFQDTDGAQWTVMRKVFSFPERRLMIIGDPKQAIYAFRGADVHVYLDAKLAADQCGTMTTNRRSDPEYIEAQNRLWSQDSRAFELDAVDYVKVNPAPGLKAARIRGLPRQGERGRRAFELRWVDGESLRGEGRVISSKAVGQELCAALAAQEAARLLENSVEIFCARDAAAPKEQSWSHLRPGDIAVLVRTNAQAERVRRHLSRLRVPSVSAGRGSVMASPVLGWLCAWLDALADPGRDRPARALATTPLFGWTALDLASAIAAADAPSQAAQSAEEQEAAKKWSRWSRRIHDWAGSWPKRGFVRVFEQALDDCDVLVRLLGANQGERYATDLRHLVELCHAEERRTRMGPSGLATWLRACCAAAGDGSDEAQALRLESDARAVQIVTVHKSKGLEYPVILLPFGWADREEKGKDGPLAWHGELAEGSELRLNLEAKGTEGRLRAIAHAQQESRQEQTRLLYVALTRAKHHCVAWLGPLGSDALKAEAYALGRIALRERDAAGRPLEEPGYPTFPKNGGRKNPETVVQTEAAQESAWVEVQRRLDVLAESSTESIGWSHEPVLGSRSPVSLEAEAGADLEARPWPSERSLGSPWQVSSYSALVSGLTHDAGEPQRLDEQRAETEFPDLSEEQVGVEVELGEPLKPAPSLEAVIASAKLRGGVETGTWAHSVLEELDFQSGDGRDGRSCEELVAELGARMGVRAPGQHELLRAMLPAILDTPLDGASALPEGFSLRALKPADRLDELGFDLRLGSGSHWRGPGGEADRRVNHEGVRAALASRLGDQSWGGEAWLRAILERSEREGKPVLPRIAGILTGFIDLTFRIPDSEGGHRYYLSDYKTNRIAPPSQRRDSRLRHYTKPWMAWEMAHHGYHLQALLYSVALHRMLRQRLGSGYDYERHIGGHLYLFLRGMSGPESPRDEGLALGLYFDRWPAAVVYGLDAALSGEPSEVVLGIIEAAKSQGGEA